MEYLEGLRQTRIVINEGYRFFKAYGETFIYTSKRKILALRGEEAVELIQRKDGILYRYGTYPELYDEYLITEGGINLFQFYVKPRYGVMGSTVKITVNEAYLKSLSEEVTRIVKRSWGVNLTSLLIRLNAFIDTTADELRDITNVRDAKLLDQIIERRVFSYLLKRYPKKSKSFLLERFYPVVKNRSGNFRKTIVDPDSGERLKRLSDEILFHHA